MSEAGRLTGPSLGTSLKKKQATLFDIFQQPDRVSHGPTTSNQAVDSNCTESANASCSTSETHTASQSRCNRGGDRTTPTPFQPKDMATICLT